jgi:hypothetical protein
VFVDEDIVVVHAHRSRFEGELLRHIVHYLGAVTTSVGLIRRWKEEFFSSTR